MPLWIPNGASGFNGTLAVANGGTGGATARAGAAAMSVPYVLAQSGVQVSHTGNTNETALATIAIPAGAMGANGRVRVTALWGHTNSVNNKTCRIRFGGTSGTIVYSITNTTTAHHRAQVEGANRNATGSQVWAPNGLTGSFGATSGSLVTGAIDTTAAVDIVILGTLASSGETISLESYLVELIAAAGT